MKNNHREPERPLDQPPQILAAVDLGSNSFHMIVSQLRNGELNTIDRLKETIRLGAGLDSSKRLTDKAQSRALECLQRFGERLRDLPQGNVRAVGTNTLRRARNANKFLANAQQALGHPIDIISGIEEARLIYLGIAQTLSTENNRRLAIDIGGGSTECIIGTGTTPIAKESLHVGCISMSTRYFGDGKISSKRIRRAVMAVLQEFEPIQLSFQNLGWDEAVGSSGTFRAVMKVMAAAGWSQNYITQQGLESLLEAMIDAGHVDKLDLPELSDDRRPVFPGGVAIVHAIFKAFKLKRLSVSDGALREGLLYELLGRIFREDTRTQSVNMLAERYHIDSKHALRVNATAQYCLEQISLPKTIDFTIASQRLEWAANLHEIGLDISHSQYHKHGGYILENSELSGFGRQEQKVLAVLVRSHRRKFPLKLSNELSAPWDEFTKTLAIILRLSVLLHRSRSLDAVPDVKLKMNGESLKIDFPKRWLAQHPLTQADLDQEAEYLEKTGFQLRYES